MAEGGKPQNVYHVNIQGGSFVAGDQVGEKSEVIIAGGMKSEGDDAENSDVGRTESDRVARYKGKRQFSVAEPEKKDKGLTWLLEGKIVMYKKRLLSKFNRMVFYGRQKLLSDRWREVAIKLIENKKKNAREVDFLMQLHHPNIVQMFDAGEYETGVVDYLYIVMELCAQNLRNYIDENPFDFQNSFSFSKQIAKALAFLHENLIAHRDLKPDNVLISFDKKTIKLSDFGLGKEIPEDYSASSVTAVGAGTEGFKSPETYQPNTRVSPSVDIFPYGLIVHFTFTKGKHPYGTNPNQQSYNIMTDQNRDLSLVPEFDEPNSHKRAQLLDLLDQTLQYNPRDRPTAESIRKHAFFSDVIVDDSKKITKKLDGVKLSTYLGSLSSESKKPDQAASTDQGQHYESAEEIDVSDVQIPESRSKKQLQAEANRNPAQAFKRKEIVRPPVQKPSIIIFDRNSKHLQRFNPRNQSVTQMHEFNDEMKRNFFSSVSIGDQIYVLMDRSTYRLKYCDVTATLERMADLIVDHGWNPPAVVVSGSIIIAGGSGTFTKSVTKYDPSLNRWKKLKDKQLETRYSANVASRGFVYCCGGIMDSELEIITDRVERLSVVSQSWDEVASMREARYNASAVECRGNLFVAGGRVRNHVDRLNSVEKYDPDVNQWTIVKPMTKKRSFFRCHLIDGNIYAVGPGNKGIEKYDVENNNWEPVHSPEVKNMIFYESVLVKMTK